MSFVQLLPLRETSYKEISRGRPRKLLRDILTAITVFLAILVADRTGERPDDKMKISRRNCLGTRRAVPNVFTKSVANNRSLSRAISQVDYRPVYLSWRYTPFSSLNTSYASLKRLVQTKFPTGIAQHREIHRTVRITEEIDTEGRDTKAKGIACNPFDANPTVRRFPEADVDCWESLARNISSYNSISRDINWDSRCVPPASEIFHRFSRFFHRPSGLFPLLATFSLRLLLAFN